MASLHDRLSGIRAKLASRKRETRIAVDAIQGVADRDKCIEGYLNAISDDEIEAIAESIANNNAVIVNGSPGGRELSEAAEKALRLRSGCRKGAN